MVIKNLWNNVSLICGCHEKETFLTPNMKGNSLFYSCPKYYDMNREQGERACTNHITVDDYERIILCLGDIIANNEKNNIVGNLTGHTWSDGKIQYKVVRHDENKIYVSVVNEIALRR